MLLALFIFLFFLVYIAWIGYRNMAMTGYILLLVTATVWFCLDMTSVVAIQL